MNVLSITKAIAEPWWATGRAWLFRRSRSDLIGNWSGAFLYARQAETSPPKKLANLSAAIPSSTISPHGIFKPRRRGGIWAPRKERILTAETQWVQRWLHRMKFRPPKIGRCMRGHSRK